MTRRLFLVVSGLLVSFVAGNARAQGLTLTVDNVRNDRGQIVVLIFDDAEAFDYLAYEWVVGYATVPAKPGSVSQSFSDLTAGPYAVFVFHDENTNWDLNTDGNRLLEGVGASGAPEPDDMPDFNAASVWPGPVTVTVHYDE